MLTAALLLAAAIALPSPYQIAQAETLIRCPDLDAAVLTERDRGAVMAAAARLELFAPGETLLGMDEYGVDALYLDVPGLVEVLRLVHAELAYDPPLAAADRLPPKAACLAAANLNGILADLWAHTAAWEPERAERFKVAAAAASAYRDFWLEAGFASDPEMGMAARRRCLAAVREAVGPAAFAAGEWPEFAPADLFRPR